MATPPDDVVFLFDVDNTLLDNDRFTADLRTRLIELLGEVVAAGYWQHYEQLRHECGFADYLGALQCLRSDPALQRRDDLPLLQLSAFLLEYPFAERAYPRAMDVLKRLRAFGPTVILSDGDVVLQPRKVQRSGLWDAVGGRVRIHIHKQDHLDALQRVYPARHYVMVDDKRRLLHAMKQVIGARLTTVWPRQGHYATDPGANDGIPEADVTVQSIGELCDIARDRLFPCAATAVA